MCIRLKTYRNEKPYQTLSKFRKLFCSTTNKCDYQKIAKANDIYNTIWALRLFSFRINNLCESILSYNNFYANAIVYRSLLEHVIKHKYIVVSCEKKGDVIAEEYVSSEHFTFEMINVANKMIWPEQPNSKKRNYSEDQIRTIDLSIKVGKSFSLDKISKEFVVLSNNNDEVLDFFRNILAAYSNLSSYVHAGPKAVLNLEDTKEKSFDIPSVMLTIISYRDIIALLSYHPSQYKSELEKTCNEMNQIISENQAEYEKSFQG